MYLCLAFEAICAPMTHPELSPFELMQAAVDIVNSSAHGINKVAATLAGTGFDGTPYAISRTNGWPGIIERLLGRDARIGDSSGTVHAETACILGALDAGYPTQGAVIYITDPLCPNCAKNVAEAGIVAIYIDSKGFSKDFAERRGGHFRSMSLEICEKAGIAVYEINRKEKTIHRIYEPGERYLPPQDYPVEVLALPPEGWQSLIAQRTEDAATHNFALAPVTDREGKIRVLYALPHLSMGYTNADPPNFHESADSKYSFIIGPTNRLLMYAARHGYALDKSAIYTARVPTARELVNLVGAGVTHIAVGDTHASRDEGGLQAIEMLGKAGILTLLDKAEIILPAPESIIRA